MALSAPTGRQKQYAGILAWERGKKIAVWPETSSGVSGLINSLMLMPALPITEQQVELIRGHIADAIACPFEFDPAEYATLPDNRADANKTIAALKRVMNPPDKTRAAFIESRDAAAAYLVVHPDEVSGTSPYDAVADGPGPVEDEEVPF
jgi:hypothetical protein